MLLACTWFLNTFLYPRYKSKVEELLIDMFFLADWSFKRDPLTAGKHHVQTLKVISARWLRTYLDNRNLETPAKRATVTCILLSCYMLQDLTRSFENTALTPLTKHFIPFLDFQSVLQTVCPTIHV